MKNYINKVCLAILFSLLLSGGGLMAQQQVMFTQYMFNGLALNPAYAGSQESLSLTALAREQWRGVEGAPSTQTFSAHSPLREGKIGLGLLFLHDQIGLTNQTGVYGSYAYRISFSGSKTLSMGLQAGFSHFNARYSKLSETDPAFAGQDVKELHPNFGFGLYYTTNRWYVGASVPQLAENIFDRKDRNSAINQVRHYFLSAGYVMDLNENLKLKPNLLVKAVGGAPLEFDLNANLLIKNLIWVGASWRSMESIDALVQLQLTDQLQLGYAYDFATTAALHSINAGSHELMLNYRMGLFKRKIITPRYF